MVLIFFSISEDKVQLISFRGVQVGFDVELCIPTGERNAPSVWAEGGLGFIHSPLAVGIFN